MVNDDSFLFSCRKLLISVRMPYFNGSVQNHYVLYGTAFMEIKRATRSFDLFKIFIVFLWFYM